MGTEENTEDSNIEHINTYIVEDEVQDTYEDDMDVEDYSEEKPIQDVEDKKVEPNKPEKNEAKKPRFEEKQETRKPVNESRHEHKKFEIKKKHVEVRRPMKKKIINPAKKPEKRIFHKNHNHEEKNKWMWVWIVLAVIIIAVAAFFIYKLATNKPVVDKETTEIAATVNGEPIYLSDIDAQYNNMNPILQQMYTKEHILNQTIDELLLIQEAKNMDIKISDEEVDVEVKNFQDENGLSDKDLDDLLVNQNLTMDKLNDLIRKRLEIKELLNKTILKDISVSDDAIEEYYTQNKDKYVTPERVTVSHILILIDTNRTEAQALAQINAVEKKLNDTNFCELALEYTEDPGSKTTCGTYTFGKNEMVQEFEEASFSLDINETEIVKTVYGYHLIKKLASEPESTLSFDEVEESIRTQLHDEQAQKNFDVFMEELRVKADIVNYLMKTDTTEKPATTITTTINPGNTVVNTQGSNLDAFAKCLDEKGVVFYGAYWCPHCNNQKELFGDSFQYIEYVECGVEGNTQLQSKVCKDAKITGYPTWEINGQRYPGEQSLDTIAKLSGCTQ